jgi:hypothetical protein
MGCEKTRAGRNFRGKTGLVEERSLGHLAPSCVARQIRLSSILYVRQ